MSVSARQLAQTLITLAEEKPDQIDGVVANFVELLEEYNLTGKSDVILRHLEAHKNTLTAQGTLKISAKHDVSETLLKKIKTSLNVEKDAPVELDINEDHDGGVIAEYQGMVLDASTDSILNRLTHQLTE